MVKRKELRPREGEVQAGGREIAGVEDDDIIELDEIVEEPDVLPVGEELEDLLAEEETNDDFQFDIEKLDMELGQDDVPEDLGEDDAPLPSDSSLFGDEPLPRQERGERPPSGPPSSQDAIDDLLTQATAEEESSLEKDDAPSQAPPAAFLEREPSAPLVDVNAVIQEIEQRLAAKFEAFVEEHLPSLVLEAVRKELRELLKAYEDV